MRKDNDEVALLSDESIKGKADESSLNCEYLAIKQQLYRSALPLSDAHLSWA